MTALALRLSHVQVPMGPLAIISQWLTRRRMRQELLTLDDEQLTDVGLSKDVVLAAASRPFWSA